MIHIPTYEQFINENVTQDDLELVGPNVAELLDAINKLNGAQLSGKAFKYRDNVKLNQIDNTGHVISKDKFYVEVIPQKLKQPIPNTNEYLKAANQFLEENGFSCKLDKRK